MRIIIASMPPVAITIILFVGLIRQVNQNGRAQLRTTAVAVVRVGASPESSTNSNPIIMPSASGSRHAEQATLPS